MTPSSSPLPARNFFYKLMASEKAYVARPRPSAQRSGIKIDLYRNETEIPQISGNELDPRLPLKPNFSTLGSRTALAFFQKTSKNSHISVVVAPIGLKFCVCARFCSSGLLGHFQLNWSTFLTVNLT